MNFPVAYLCKGEDSESFVTVAESLSELPQGTTFIILKAGVKKGEQELMELAISGFIEHFQIKK